MIERESLREATARIAEPIVEEQARNESAFIFRLGTEWFAFPANACERVIDQCAIHSIPHRNNGVLLGIGNVSGDLVPVVSMQRLLGIPDGEGGMSRLLLFAWHGSRFALPVSEVFGVHRYHRDEKIPAPATLATSSAFSTNVLRWNGKTAGFLDPDRLHSAIVTAVS